MEQLEAWLKDQGLEIVSQYMTGSGDMVRYRLRLPNGSEVDVGFSATLLMERPFEAIDIVRRSVEEHEDGIDHRRTNGHDRT